MTRRMAKKRRLRKGSNHGSCGRGCLLASRSRDLQHRCVAALVAGLVAHEWCPIFPTYAFINPPASKTSATNFHQLPSSNDDLSINLLTFYTNASSLPSL